jgi:hypothetical protein
MPRGGKRPGAGRKPEGVSERQVTRLLKAFKRRAKEEGQDVFDLLAEIAYDKTAYKVQLADGVEDVYLKVPVRDRLRAIEVFANLTIVRRTQTTVRDERTGPQIGLPPLKEKPPEAYPTVAEKAN